MSQWTVAIDPLLRRPDGTCEVRVRTNAKDAKGQPLYVTLIVRDGETVRSDDPEVIAALDGLTSTAAGKVVTPLAQRPASPTYDVDTKTRAPLPADGTKAAADGGRTK